jgi:hypothetical protein
MTRTFSLSGSTALKKEPATALQPRPNAAKVNNGYGNLAVNSKSLLVVRFMLTFPGPTMPWRTTSHIFGGPIHAAALNRQQRSDHWAFVPKHPPRNRHADH